MKKQKVKKDIKELLDNISEKEVLKLRECSCDKNGFDDYVYKASDKILKKIVNPFFRFAVLQNCILDAKNNSEFYPNIDKKKVNFLYKKLQKMCVFLNIVMDEYCKLLTKIQHPQLLRNCFWASARTKIIPNRIQAKAQDLPMSKYSNAYLYMEQTITFVEFAGPPEVITQIKSKI